MGSIAGASRQEPRCREQEVRGPSAQAEEEGLKGQREENGGVCCLGCLSPLTLASTGQLPGCCIMEVGDGVTGSWTDPRSWLRVWMLQKEGCCLTRGSADRCWCCPNFTPGELGSHVSHSQILLDQSHTPPTQKKARHKKSLNPTFFQALGPSQAFEDLKTATHQTLLRHPDAL